MWVKVRGVVDQPRLTLFEIRAEFTVLCWKRTHGTIQYFHWLRFLCHFCFVPFFFLSSPFSPLRWIYWCKNQIKNQTDFSKSKAISKQSNIMQREPESGVFLFCVLFHLLRVKEQAYLCGLYGLGSWKRVNLDWAGAKYWNFFSPFKKKV